MLLSTVFFIDAPADSQADRLVQAALDRAGHKVVYNGAYFAIEYPGGDIPPQFGVCTDVLIRSYRALGIDLQREVHLDMQQHFDAYPSRRIWGLSKTDRNIDHRRVPNLQTFFSRKGQVLAVSDNPADYHAGDLVTWKLNGRLPHIGIVTDRFAPGGKRPLIVHNVGAGPRLEDVLFAYPIDGHYRYLPTVD